MCLLATEYLSPFYITQIIAKLYFTSSLMHGCELSANCGSTSKRKLNVRVSPNWNKSL